VQAFFPIQAVAPLRIYLHPSLLRARQTESTFSKSIKSSRTHIHAPCAQASRAPIRWQALLDEAIESMKIVNCGARGWI